MYSTLLHKTRCIVSGKIASTGIFNFAFHVLQSNELCETSCLYSISPHLSPLQIPGKVTL